MNTRMYLVSKTKRFLAQQINMYVHDVYWCPLVEIFSDSRFRSFSTQAALCTVKLSQTVYSVSPCLKLRADGSSSSFVYVCK